MSEKKLDNLSLPHRTSVEMKKGMRELTSASQWPAVGRKYSTTLAPGGSIRDIYERGDWKHDNWAIDGLVREGSKILLAGSSNVGKTYAILDLLLASVTGTKWLGYFDVDTGPCFYFGGEGNKGMLVRRLAGLCIGRGINPDEFFFGRGESLVISMPEDYQFNFPGALANPLFFQMVYNTVHAENVENRPRITVYDPLTAMHPDVDKGPSSISGTVNAMQWLNDECGGISVLVHHLKKKQANGSVDWKDLIRGESSWSNFVDDIICLDTNADDPNIVDVHIVKARDGETSNGAAFAYRKMFTPLPDGAFPDASPGAVKSVKFTYIPRGAATPDDAPENDPPPNSDDSVAQMDEVMAAVVNALSQANESLDKTALKEAVGPTVTDSTFLLAVGQLSRDKVISIDYSDVVNTKYRLNP